MRKGTQKMRYIAQGVGLLAVALFLLSYQQKKRKNIICIVIFVKNILKPRPRDKSPMVHLGIRVCMEKM